jgi:hypothetical protein
MLKPHFGFQGIEHGLDNETFAQQLASAVVVEIRR